MAWNKKKKKKEEENKMNVHISVIPDIFYGGKDPLIYHEDNRKIPGKPKEKKIAPKNKVALPVSKKKIIIISIVIVLLFTAGVTFYYFRQASLNAPKQPATVTPPKQETVTQPVVQEPPVEEPEVTQPEPETVTTTEPEVVEQQNTIVFPSILLRDSSDMDADSLTDQEEEIFGTDSGIWDTDKDGYYDGQEVLNLYNPKGFAPVKIIDSGLVKEYINPTWKYRVYYPAVWEEASVDNESNHVIFSSITGDFIEIRSFSKTANENFVSWFAKNIEGQSFADLSYTSNRFKIDGYIRKDNLVAYFVIDNAVFVMVYEPSGNATDIPYRHVMEMMFQSFRPSAVSVDLPEQTALPEVPAAPEIPEPEIPEPELMP